VTESWESDKTVFTARDDVATEKKWKPRPRHVSRLPLLLMPESLSRKPLAVSRKLSAHWPQP